MTNYIENFDENKNKELEEIQSFETQICDSLQQASKQLMMMNQLAGKAEFKELKEDAKFKGDQAKNAKQTLDMLKVEYEKKIQEVKNLDHLEGAIEKVPTFTYPPSSPLPSNLRPSRNDRSK